ncbi:MAG TPA: DUF2461 family protein, partial [Bacteroidota bacterium]|nr:DUF2461 family protein [Bacteroidota bacterium]
QRIPKGYPPDHPMGEWLKYKQFFVGTSWPEGKCFRTGFTADVARAFETAAPLVRFLNEAVK